MDAGQIWRLFFLMVLVSSPMLLAVEYTPIVTAFKNSDLDAEQRRSTSGSISESTPPHSANTPIAAESTRNSPGSHYHYRELAETEHRRAGFYFPIPFVVGGLTGTSSQRGNGNNNRSRATTPTARYRVIPSEVLGQLVRQHIAHQRQRLLLQQQDGQGRITASLLSNQLDDGRPILEGVQRLTELRQTPFQRFPDEQLATLTANNANNNNSSFSYEEKRRRWKAEMKRRWRANKQKAAQQSHPEGQSGETETGEVQVKGGKNAMAPNASHQQQTLQPNQYYVTYSPQSNIYQVSRRPPPDYTPDSIQQQEEHLAEGAVVGPTEEGGGTTTPTPIPTDTNELETSLMTPPSDGTGENQASSGDSEVIVVGTEAPSSEPTAVQSIISTVDFTKAEELSTTTTAPMPTEATQQEESSQEIIEETPGDSPIFTSPSTTLPPLFIYVQETEALAESNRTYESIARVGAAAKPIQRLSPVKQILRIDDYIEEDEYADDDEGESVDDDGKEGEAQNVVADKDKGDMKKEQRQRNGDGVGADELRRQLQEKNVAATTSSASTTSPLALEPSPASMTGSLSKVEEGGVGKEDEEEEEEDEDLFFWKPDYDPRRVAAATQSSSALNGGGRSS